MLRQGGGAVTFTARRWAFSFEELYRKVLYGHIATMLLPICSL